MNTVVIYPVETPLTARIQSNVRGGREPYLAQPLSRGEHARTLRVCQKRISLSPSGIPRESGAHRTSLACLAPRLLLPLGHLVGVLPEERVLLALGGGATRPLGVRETRAARELAHGAALARDVGHALLDAAARAGDVGGVVLLVDLHVPQVGREHLAEQRELLLLLRLGARV